MRIFWFYLIWSQIVCLFLFVYSIVPSIILMYWILFFSIYVSFRNANCVQTSLKLLSIPANKATISVTIQFTKPHPMFGFGNLQFKRHQVKTELNLVQMWASVVTYNHCFNKISMITFQRVIRTCFTLKFSHLNAVESGLNSYFSIQFSTVINPNTCRYGDWQ